jgi:hypothetical protein
LRRRRSPSIVPDVVDRNIYLVRFRQAWRSWRETDEQSTDRAAVIQDLLEGQYSGPVRVIAFNTAEGWSRDVSEEIADELALACADKDQDIPAGFYWSPWQRTTGAATVATAR